MNAIRTFFGLSLLVPLTACGAADGSDFQELDEEQQAIGEGSCLTTRSNVLLSGDSSAHSPTTYDNPECRKTYIFASPTIGDIGSGVSWYDRHQRAPRDCDGGTLTVQLMSRTKVFPVPAFYRNDGTFSAPLVHGAVENFFTDTCWFPSFHISARDGVTRAHFEYDYASTATDILAGRPDDIEFVLPNTLEGRSVRFAAQALTPRGSTQSVAAGVRSTL